MTEILLTITLMQLTRLSAVVFSPIWIALLICFTSQFSSQAHAGQTIEEFKNYDVSEVSHVEIKVDPVSWERLCRQNRSMVQSFGRDLKSGKSIKPFSYFQADISINGQEFKDVGIRKKGFIGSLDGQRPSLKVKLNHIHKDQTLDGVTHLTLNNCKQDSPIINQYLAYNLFNKAGSPAPRASFSKVMVNGDSLGIYCRVESMKKPMVEKAFGSDKGVLFEGTLTDFYPEFEKSFDRKFGSKDSGIAAIKKLTSIIHSEVSDEVLIDELDQILDIDAFLKFWAIESLIGFWDGYTGNKNNFFFYLDPKDKKFRFMPWGADSVFTSRSGFGRRGFGPQTQFVKTNAVLAGRLYQIPEIRDQYAKVMKDVLDKYWDPEWMIGESTRLEEMLEPHTHEAQSRFTQGLYSLREFITYRKEDLLAEEADGIPEIPFNPSPPRSSTTIGKLKGDVIFSVLEKHPGETDGLGMGALKADLYDEEYTSVGHNYFAHKTDPNEQQFGNRGFGRGGFGGFFGRGRGNPEDMIQIVLEVFYGDYPDQLTLRFSIHKQDLSIADETPIAFQGSVTVGNEFSKTQESHSLSGILKVSSSKLEEGNRIVGASLEADLIKMQRFGRF